MGLGLWVQRSTRAAAAQRLAQARTLHAGGDPLGALQELGRAFWVPISDRYSAEDATTAHAVVVFLEQLLREMNLQPEPLTQSVRQALDGVRQQGGEVPSAISSPLEQFMSELAAADNLAAVEALVSRAGALATGEEATHMSALTAAESTVINAVGAHFLRRAYPEALQTIDQHLPQASVALRAALLGQRGAVLHLMRDLSGARACYVEAAQLEPQNPHYWWNVAEAEEQIGARDAAVDAVRRVLRLPVDAHTRREAEEMLVRLSA